MRRSALDKVGLLAALGFSLLGCDDKKGSSTHDSPAQAPAPRSSEASGSGAKLGVHDAPAGLPAEVGERAPGFTLKDLSGKPVSLGDFKGKIVVLEWFNPECPFVKASHEKGSLKGLARNYHGKDDVVWLAVNSGAEGRQGHGVEKNRAAVEAYSLPHPVLLDEQGSVGKAYGATNTPHLFIVDTQGKLAYQGAIDNSPDGEAEAAPDGNLVNYVSQALSELSEGKPVSMPETKAYGCSVKYAS
jgi:peroxiredoxin